MSSIVTGRGVPPDADTLCNGDVGVGVNRISLAWFHAPVALTAADATTMGEPPAGSTVFSCPPATNAITRESGDQNGDEAPSVPASEVAASESSGRTHSI